MVLPPGDSVLPAFHPLTTHSDGNNKDAKIYGNGRGREFLCALFGFCIIHSTRVSSFGYCFIDKIIYSTECALLLQWGVGVWQNAVASE